MPDEDPPKIKDHKGPLDEYLAYFIVAVPFLVLLLVTLVGAVLVLTGQIPVDVTISGSLSASTFVLPIALLVGLAWVLALAKVFGFRPIAWIANAARDYEG